MKTTFLALCLFLFAYKATSSIILDTDNQPVSNFASYYLEPVSPNNNGGLQAATVGNEEEPKAVVLDPDSSPGLPVRFETRLPTPIITTAELLNIYFVSSSDLGKWGVRLEFPIGWALRVLNAPTIMGQFRVEKAHGGYKIVYFPDQGETGGDVGLVHKEGEYRLVVKDGEPFVFKIKKATEESSAGIRSMV